MPVAEEDVTDAQQIPHREGRHVADVEQHCAGQKQKSMKRPGSPNGPLIRRGWTSPVPALLAHGITPLLGESLHRIKGSSGQSVPVDRAENAIEGRAMRHGLTIRTRRVGQIDCRRSAPVMWPRKGRYPLLDSERDIARLRSRVELDQDVGDVESVDDRQPGKIPRAAAMISAPIITSQRWRIKNDFPSVCRSP